MRNKIEVPTGYFASVPTPPHIIRDNQFGTQHHLFQELFVHCFLVFFFLLSFLIIWFLFLMLLIFLIIDGLCIAISVTRQVYDSHTFHETVILGNDAIFKCSIPSFVSDFVSTVAWVDSEGELLGSQPNTHISGTLGSKYCI